MNMAPPLIELAAPLFGTDPSQIYLVEIFQLDFKVHAKTGHPCINSRHAHFRSEIECVYCLNVSYVNKTPIIGVNTSHELELRQL